MKMFRLEELTEKIVNEYFKNNSGMEIITNSGTKYHIIKTPKGVYHCLSWYCMSERRLTKTMKKVFC